MRATWWFARQTLAARRSRSALLGTAVALSSALVMAVACALETVRVNTEGQVARFIGEADARLVNRFGASFDSAALEEVRALPGVAAVAGSLAGSITVVNPGAPPAEDGSMVPPRAVIQCRGLDADADAAFRGQALKAGRLPAEAGEIALDPLGAAQLRAEIGARLQVQRFGDPLSLRVVGILDRPSLGALQRAYAVVDRATLVEATGKDRVTSVMVKLAPRVDPGAWIAAHRDAFKDPLVLEPSERVSSGLDRQVLATRLGFLLVTTIAFMSAAFIVGTGMTTAVAEQQRELAIARCVGASRAQVFGSQVWAGLVLCAAGGAAGVPIGLAVAAALVAWFREALPDGFSWSPAGVGLAMAGSAAAGVLGALWPAWQAARISPLAALASQARPPSRAGIAWLALAGAGCIAAQLLLLLIPDFDARFWAYVGAGIVLEHLGWFLLAVPILWVSAVALVRPLAVALRIPVPLLAGAVAQAPYRLGFTAGALMVGVSIMVTTWTNGTTALRELTERVRISDGFVFKTNGMSVEEQARVRALPGVEAVVPIGYLPLRIVGERGFGVKGLDAANVVCVGFPPDDFLRINRLEWIEGSAESALPKLRSGDGVLVAKEFLVARGKRVGGTIRLGSARASKEYEIVGVVGAAGLDVATQFFGIRSVYMEQAVSCVFMDFGEVAERFGSRDAYILQVDMDDTLGPEADAALAKAVGEAVPGGVYANGRAIRDTIQGVGRTVLSVTSAVAFGALLLACVGVGNVVAANISARRFEYGVLRATGASPWLLARLVGAEVGLIAVAGAATGTGLGLHVAALGLMWHRELTGVDLPLAVPFGPIAVGYAVLLALTLGAALPAVARLVRVAPRALLAH
jgi:putative ABC transport system permease protein